MRFNVYQETVRPSGRGCVPRFLLSEMPVASPGCASERAPNALHTIKLHKQFVELGEMFTLLATKSEAQRKRSRVFMPLGNILWGPAQVQWPGNTGSLLLGICFWRLHLWVSLEPCTILLKRDRIQRIQVLSDWIGGLVRSVFWNTSAFLPWGCGTDDIWTRKALPIRYNPFWSEIWITYHREKKKKHLGDNSKSTDWYIYITNP